MSTVKDGDVTLTVPLIGELFIHGAGRPTGGHVARVAILGDSYKAREISATGARSSGSEDACEPEGPAKSAHFFELKRLGGG